jgi:agmatinase
MHDDLYPPYVSFLGVPSTAPDDAPAVSVLPLPYDLTTSYQPGSRRGPLAILHASCYVETWDDEVERDLAEELHFTTLGPVVPETAGPAAMQARIRRVADEVVASGAFLVGLGGEHSVTPPLVQAVRRRHPKLGVLQLDAHADLRDSYEGSPANHACAMHQLVAEGIPLAQVGIRSLTRPEQELVREKGICTVFAAEAARRPVAEWVGRVVDALPDQVYVTVDLDAFDPSIMPATGTPEPGGLGWYETLELLRTVAERRRIVGCDVVELMPIPGFAGPDFLAAKLVCKLLAYALLLKG